MNDNVMDPFHVQVLHSTFSGVQFVPQFASCRRSTSSTTDHGVCYSAVRKLDDGREVDRISSWLLPNIMSVPDIALSAGPSTGISWVVPVDDTHYVQAMVDEGSQGQRRCRSMLLNGKTWGEMTEEEHQRTPGDYEAQAGQGPHHPALRGASA